MAILVIRQSRNILPLIRSSRRIRASMPWHSCCTAHIKLHNFAPARCRPTSLLQTGAHAERAIVGDNFLSNKSQSPYALTFLALIKAVHTDSSLLKCHRKSFPCIGVVEPCRSLAATVGTRSCRENKHLPLAFTALEDGEIWLLEKFSFR